MKQQEELVKFVMPSAATAAVIDSMATKPNQSLKLEFGNTRLRMLPAPVGASWSTPIVKVSGHYLKFGDKILYLNCAYRMARTACPACELSEQLKKDRNPLNRELGDNYSARERYYANVVVRSEEGEQIGPQKLAFSWKVYSWFQDELKNGRTGFCDPSTNGDDVIINKIKKGNGPMDVDYQVKQTKDCFSVPLAGTLKGGKWIADVAKINMWMREQPSLGDLLRVDSYEDMRVAIAESQRQAGMSTAFDPEKFERDNERSIQGDIRAIEGQTKPDDDDYDGDDDE